ncbi:hypothetical protein [Bacillus thuringiensis]|uniref:hypothetical protein n=1 Tax=Bacillus thuringiensis TaxID=1428 RepID=UPI002AB4235E|nr:hypothetical protein [Bacillus thuringiensis]MDY7965718.1 hypothetical protein [Bacillus thuringiensis]
MDSKYQNHIQDESHSNALESNIESNIHKHSNVKEKNHRLPFSVVLNIPKGFQIQKEIDPKLMYDLNHLSMIKETCKKSIEVDNCGHVDVDLHALKIKGCLSFLLNLYVEPIHESKICTKNTRDGSIALFYQETLYVDHVVKYSVGRLPYYVIDDEHIHIRHLEIKVLDENCEMAKVSGEFYFEYE